MAGADALVPLMPLALAGWPASQNPVAEAGSYPDNLCHIDMSQLLVRTCFWERQHHVQPQRLAHLLIILAVMWQALTGCVFCRATTFRDSTALTTQQMIRLMYSSRWRNSGRCRVCELSDISLAAIPPPSTPLPSMSKLLFAFHTQLIRYCMSTWARINKSCLYMSALDAYVNMQVNTKSLCTALPGLRS